jgi:hypothetical protein
MSVHSSASPVKPSSVATLLLHPGSGSSSASQIPIPEQAENTEENYPYAVSVKAIAFEMFNICELQIPANRYLKSPNQLGRYGLFLFLQFECLLFCVIVGRFLGCTWAI